MNVQELRKKVIETKAHIGFAFDGDGDRLIVVDEKGNEVDGDKIIALFAKYLFSIPVFLHPRDDVILKDKYTAGEYLNDRLNEIGLKKIT